MLDVKTVSCKVRIKQAIEEIKRAKVVLVFSAAIERSVRVYKNDLISLIEFEHSEGLLNEVTIVNIDEKTIRVERA